MKSRFLIFALCLSPFAFTLTGCREKSSAAEPTPAPVKVKTVEMNPAGKGVRYSANIEPMKQVELAFKVNGYVDRILQARGVDGRMRDIQAGDALTRGAAPAPGRRSGYPAQKKKDESQR